MAQDSDHKGLPEEVLAAVPASLRSGETRFAVLLDSLCSKKSEEELSKQPSLVLALIIAIISGAFVAAGIRIESPLLTLAGCSCVGSIAVWFGVRYISSQRLVGEYKELFSVAREELADLAEQVTDYLYRLDLRTSRYFHCVTTTKITTYFMLRQIESGLSDVVEQLGRACRNNSREEALSALKLLRRPFYYRDGFLDNSGKIYQVLLRDLPLKVVSLMDSLELNIRELERELSSWQSSDAEHESLD